MATYRGQRGEMRKKTLMVGVIASLAFAGCYDDDSADGSGDPVATSASAAARPTAAPVATAAPATTAAATAAPKAVPALDTAFGAQGVRPTPVSTSEDDRFFTVATGPDGRIYAA